MPTYQYRCESCGEVFEQVEHLAEHGTAHPSCSNCGSEMVQHVPTPFAAMTSKKSLASVHQRFRAGYELPQDGVKCNAAVFRASGAALHPPRRLVV
jgi:putative FmdB family regulatory protein